MDSQRTVLYLSVVFLSEASSVVYLTVSKALEKSKDKDTDIERYGTGRCLKPEITMSMSGRSAVVVERWKQKPGWELDSGRQWNSGSRRRSRTLPEEEKREMKRNLVPASAGLPALRKGMIIVEFQMAGMSACV